jgi:hypothetical protein
MVCASLNGHVRVRPASRLCVDERARFALAQTGCAARASLDRGGSEGTAGGTELIHAAEAATLPTSFGVFKPVGYVTTGVPAQAQFDALVSALHGAGWHTSGVRQFSPRESVAELRAMVDNTGPLAGFGYEITLLRRYVALTEEGYLWLLVQAVCHTDKGNWLSNSPAAIRVAAVTIASAFMASSRPRSKFTSAAARLICASACTIADGIRCSPMAKKRRLRSVCAPHSASPGTSLGPKLSVSVRGAGSTVMSWWSI